MTAKPRVNVYPSPYPGLWMFTVEYQGRTYRFGGMPNYCPSRRAAAIRGWWRARWLLDGSFERRYR